jgi:hypothetical protein
MISVERDHFATAAEMIGKRRARLDSPRADPGQIAPLEMAGFQRTLLVTQRANRETCRGGFQTRPLSAEALA